MGGFRVDRVCRRSVAVADGDGRVVIARCRVAEGPWARLVGLLGTPDLAPDEGVWLSRCRSVHTIGMRISIACAFLDGDGRVLRIVDPLRPGRWARAAGAAVVVEALPGRFAGVAPGAVLVASDASEASEPL